MSRVAACQVASSFGTSALRSATQGATEKSSTIQAALFRKQSQAPRRIAQGDRLASSFVSSTQDLRVAPVSRLSVSHRGFTTKEGAKSATVMAASSAYDFKVKDIDGKETDLSNFKGKVSLIVNVASACGLTKQNYQELTTVYDKFKDKDFEVLAFPCNQFGGQEPGSAEEIKKFAGEKYKASYPLFAKIDVNGPKADPLFQYLKNEAGGGDIAWNFGKFLVDKDGKVVKRFDPRTNPLAFESEVEKLL